MKWTISHRANPEAREIADRHYNRQKVGSPQFVPPGRCLVLKTPTALWITSWPFAQYVKHAWAEMMVCSAFRNEDPTTALSSDLVMDALAATRWKWPEAPGVGMVTFIDRRKTKPKPHPGYCYRVTGLFEYEDDTKGGLAAVVARPSKAHLWPDPEMPHGAQTGLF